MIAWFRFKSARRSASSLAIVWLALSACGPGSSASDAKADGSTGGTSMGGAAASSGLQPNVSNGGFTLGSGGTGGDGSRTAGNGGSAGASGTSELAAAFCAAARQCCGDPTFEGCENQAQFGLSRDGIDDPFVKINPAVMTSCIAAYRKAAPECLRPKLAAACQGLIVATQDLGADCTVDQACKADQGLAYCAGNQSSATEIHQHGTCTRVTHLAIGQPCNFNYRTQSGPDLAGGFSLSIHYFHTDPTACFESDGLVCVPNATGVQATCQPERRRGDSCEIDSQCAYTETCTMTCQPKTTEGKPCTRDDCGLDLECTAGFCRQQRMGSSLHLGDASCNSDFPRMPFF